MFPLLFRAFMATFFGLSQSPSSSRLSDIDEAFHTSSPITRRTGQTAVPPGGSGMSLSGQQLESALYATVE
jgi:hypothetical protein